MLSLLVSGTGGDCLEQASLNSQMLTFDCCSSTNRMIFLGETFSGFVTVHNDSQEVVKEVLLKVCKMALFSFLPFLLPPSSFSPNPSPPSPIFPSHLPFSSSSSPLSSPSCLSFSPFRWSSSLPHNESPCWHHLRSPSSTQEGVRRG